jgi:hypothetical protein
MRPFGVMRFFASPIIDSTQVEFEIDFECHGIGRIWAWVARHDARKQVPRDLAELKARLEAVQLT